MQAPCALLEAKPGFEPGVRALQAPALPLGHFADMKKADRDRPWCSHGAGYGVRTRDLHLGKVARYQLRQARDARRYNTGPSQPAQAPISTFFSVEKNVQVVAVNKLRFTPIEHLRRRRGCRLGNAMRIAPLPKRPSRQGLCGWRERHPWVGRGGIRRATRT